MKLTNSSEQYGLITKAIHWITALLILGLLFMGFFMVGLPFDENKLELYALHKSVGLLVLLVVFVRVAWHILSRKPKSLETHAPWEKFLAHAAHTFLYFAMFTMPLSGWIMSSAGDFSVQFFGIQLPDLVSKNEMTFKNGKQIHETIALALLIVIGLHVAGALKHHFIDHDKTIKRMTYDRVGFGGGLVLVILAGILMLPTIFLVGKDILEELQKAQEKQPETVTVAGHIGMADVNEGTGWVIDEKKSKIQFEAQQYGQSFEGRFESFGGQIFFDPASLESSKVLIKILMSSIKTGASDRDQQAVSTEWFDTENHPEAIFESQSFEKTGENQYIAHGNLTIRGIALSIDLPFELKINKKDGAQAVAKMKAEISLNRLDFGIGQGQWQSTDAIANEVKIKIEVEALQ